VQPIRPPPHHITQTSHLIKMTFIQVFDKWLIMNWSLISLLCYEHMGDFLWIIDIVGFTKLGARVELTESSARKESVKTVASDDR